MRLSIVHSSTRLVPRAEKLPSACAEDFDAIFYTLGLGSAFDIASDHKSIAWTEAMQCEGKRVAAACRRPLRCAWRTRV